MAECSNSPDGADELAVAAPQATSALPAAAAAADPRLPSQSPVASDDGSQRGAPETVRRDVVRETIGCGSTAVIRTTTVETKSYANCDQEIRKLVQETRKVAAQNVDDGCKTAGRHKHSSSHYRRRLSAASAAREEQMAFEKFKVDVVNAHNVYRAKHGQVPPLVLNDELSKLAQDWANHMLESKEFKTNSDEYRGQPVGQNVALKKSSGTAEYGAQELVDQWYSEASSYNYEVPEGKKGVRTGNFSQVVWKGSQEIGIAKARSPDGQEEYVVCNYFPAGNYIGQYKDNVFPPPRNTNNSGSQHELPQ